MDSNQKSSVYTVFNCKKPNTGFIFQENKEKRKSDIHFLFHTLTIGCFGVKLFSTPTRQLQCELSICGAIVRCLIYQRALLKINGCHYDSGNIYEKNYYSIRSWANSLRLAEELLICCFVEGCFNNTVVVLLRVVSFQSEWWWWMVTFWPLIAELPHGDEMRWSQRVTTGINAVTGGLPQTPAVFRSNSQRWLH